jgi:outer membrane protein assembly factor BamB
MRWTFPLPLLLLGSTALLAGDWPGWRGPTGQGISDEKGLPTEWDAKTGKNVRWKAPLPGGGKARPDHNQSSPIVVRGKVFVTASVWPAGSTPKDFPEHHVLCFDAAKGTQLWDSTVAHGPWSRASDLRGGYTVPTPASDGERVFVVFGSSVVAALDRAGKELWRKELVPFDFDVALASGPVVYRDRVILQLDGMKRSRLVAYDAKSGDVKWTQDRPKASFCHSTPILAKVEGRFQLLVAATSAVQGIDPEDGKLIWWCQAGGATASPVMAKGLVYCDGGRGGMGVCVDPTGKGDVTKTHRRWKLDRISQGFSSPVVVGDRLYRLTDPGVLRSWSLAKGEVGPTIRVPGASTAASPFTTPEGRIYVASAGKSHVVQTGDKLELLASNDLGDPSPASPAVADGRIYLKGQRYLWCIGAKE